MAKTTTARSRGTLPEEFALGLSRGQQPCESDTEKAIRAVASRSTTPEERAYWSGYVCQIQANDPAALHFK